MSAPTKAIPVIDRTAKPTSESEEPSPQATVKIQITQKPFVVNELK